MIHKIKDSFNNKKLFTQAITLAQGKKAASYERLEFLGDRVLGLIMADVLYHTFPGEKEGDWAIRFTSLVKEDTLADIARHIGLPAVLITQEEILRDNNSILADVCEALIAAIYLDKGLDAVRQVIMPLFTPLLKADITDIKDIKSQLQEYAQHMYKQVPTYTVISQTGSDHHPIFTVQVDVKGMGQATGVGSSKKEAMKTAATHLLETHKEKKRIKK